MARRQKFIKGTKINWTVRLNMNNFVNIEDENNIYINNIYIALELIGIYSGFKKDNKEFKTYYDNLLEHGRRYCFRKLGVDIIYERLRRVRYNNGVNDRRFYISKKSLKRSGIWYPLSKVKVYEGTDKIVEEINAYFKENVFLGDFYYEYIHKKTLEEYLRFQNDCIVDYVAYHEDEKAHYFSRMRTEINRQINVCFNK